MQLERMPHGDRAALPYHRRRPLEVCFIRYGIGIHNYAASLQAAQTDLLLATARSDFIRVYQNQAEAQMQHARSGSQNKLRFGRAALISQHHPLLGEARSASLVESSGSRDLSPIRKPFSHFKVYRRGRNEVVISLLVRVSFLSFFFHTARSINAPPYLADRIGDPRANAFCATTKPLSPYSDRTGAIGAIAVAFRRH
jgi:hypothetical protein